MPFTVRCSTQYQEALKSQKSLGKSPTDLVGLFLKQLWSHTLAAVHRALGTDLMDSCRFRVVVTLPAIWPHYAQQRMKKAAMIAGIMVERGCGPTVLKFISEPEAAAMATLKDMSKRSTVKVFVSDPFLLEALACQ